MTEKDEIPDHRCGFELKPEDSESEVHKPMEACCWRETWQDTNCCVWHAEVEHKPIEELKATRIDGPEWLDGAYLVGVEVNDDLSFRGCGLMSAAFSNGKFCSTEFHNANLTDARFCNANLTDVQFHGADLVETQFHNAQLVHTEFHSADLVYSEFDGALLRNAKFHYSHLFEVQFSDADLLEAQFYDADLLNVQFDGADLPGAQFYDADLSNVQFDGADLLEAQFNDADLTYAQFHNADLTYTQFHNADLSDAQFHNAYLFETEFYDANLTDADYTDADARDADFTDATLHDTLLTRADCRGTTFTSALLYETVFADTRINSQTTFHDPETTFYDSITSRPAVVYEENSHTSDDLPENIHPLEAAEWVYRRLEKLHDENALSEDARDFHISKEEAQRKYQWESGEYIRSAVSTLQWYVTGHGESIPRIFRSAAVLILGCGILYPFAGGFESSSTGAVYRLHPFSVELSRAAIGDTIATVLQSIYFSVITFTTIGYGDLYPTGAWSKVLVGFESLSGAILIALFVFVLGRRVAR